MLILSNIPQEIPCIIYVAYSELQKTLHTLPMADYQLIGFVMASDCG
jgi:hypothetical protein